MYALPVALKSAGVALPGGRQSGSPPQSCGTAKAKYALGEPTKLGMSSFAAVGLGKTTSGKFTPSPSLNLKTVCGRFTPETSKADNHFTSSPNTFAPAG